MVHLLSGLNYYFSYIGIPVLGWRTTMTLHTEYQYACFVNVWSRNATLEKVLVNAKVRRPVRTYSKCCAYLLMYSGA